MPFELSLPLCRHSDHELLFRLLLRQVYSLHVQGFCRLAHGVKPSVNPMTQQYDVEPSQKQGPMLLYREIVVVMQCAYFLG